LVFALNADCQSAKQQIANLRYRGPQGAKAKAEVVADILASIRERRA
jgi:hypothetical protein